LICCGLGWGSGSTPREHSAESTRGPSNVMHHSRPPSWWVQSTSHSLEELIGDQVIIADLASGECFVFTEGTFASGDLVECGDPDALMFVGTYEAADGPFPGIDPLREERAIRCVDVLAASGLIESVEAGDSATLSGTFPDEVTWLVPGSRLATCDIEPA
jgi:hypothetical protein